jgi:hypothetical protein
MPRRPTRPRVPRINLDVVRRAYRSLPGAGESDFYILEKVDGPCLRVRRTVVQVGVRYRSRFHLAAEVCVFRSKATTHSSAKATSDSV